MRIIYHSADACPQSWDTGIYISRGGYGSIHQACCNTECEYIIKEVKLENPFYGGEEAFENEVNIHGKLALQGMAPMIYDAWIEDTVGFIVMDRLKITLREYLLDYGYLSSLKLYELLMVINKMHTNGIYHDDLHGSNIMLDDNDNFYIIDFGKSKVIRSSNDAFDDYVNLLTRVKWDDVNFREILYYINEHFPTMDTRGLLETIYKYKIRK